MNIKTNGLTKRCTLYLSIGYIFAFLIYYLANYIFYDISALSYVWIFTQKLIYLLMIFIAATVMLIFYALGEKRHGYLSLIAFSLIRMIYFIPYFYLIFIYDGFDSVEALLFGLLSALADAAIFYLLALLALGVMLLIIKKSNQGGTPIDELIIKPTRLNFADPICLAFTVLSLLGFAYLFINEVIDTVSFIINYSGNLLTLEIIYIIFSYIFDLSLIFVYYFALSFIKNRIMTIND